MQKEQPQNFGTFQARSEELLRSGSFSSGKNASPSTSTDHVYGGKTRAVAVPPPRSQRILARSGGFLIGVLLFAYEAAIRTIPPMQPDESLLEAL